jgi:hypothetical protein
VEHVIWADTCKKVAEALLVLELFLQTASETGEVQIKRVILEMNVEEAREFVGRLTAIEKVRILRKTNFFVGGHQGQPVLSGSLSDI